MSLMRPSGWNKKNNKKCNNCKRVIGQDALYYIDPQYNLWCKRCMKPFINMGYEECCDDMPDSEYRKQETN